MEPLNHDQDSNKDLREKEVREIKRSKMSLFLLLLLLLLLLLSLFFGVFFIRQRTTFFGRAFNPAGQSGEVVLENSYLFASPLSAQAGGQEKIRVTVFLLDSQGKGVSGRAVFLGQDQRIQTTVVQGITDSLGRALFDVAALSPADYLIEAKVDNQILPQRVKLNFR